MLLALIYLMAQYPMMKRLTVHFSENLGENLPFNAAPKRYFLS